MACLDHSTVLRFVAGRLDGLDRERVEEELGRCSSCAGLVAEVVRGGSRPGTGSESGDLLNGSTAPSPDLSADDHAHPVGADNGASRYILGAEIAHGGMGTVYAAEDMRLLRPIAIKCLDRGARGPARRFAREIRVTAALQHPGIVPIYDSGTLPDGRAFYAMRHVPGASLEQVILSDRSGVSERLDLLVPLLAVAEAVAYAHERGIIHRDLKPSNILVGPFGETVVIDWGLARIDRQEGDEDEPGEAVDSADPLSTRQGTVLGTPRYMAPEQARGEPATRQSDVYALGAILYHALSGVPPRSGLEIASVLERAARAEVRPLAEVAPGLPDDLVAIVNRAMALERAERYEGAGELAADLRRFQTGQLVGAYSYSRGELVRRFVRRHRGAVALTALFAVALATGGAISVSRILNERRQAETAQARAERERAGAEDLVQFLLYELRGRLATVGRLDVLSGVADRVDAYHMTTAAGRAELPEAQRERAALFELRAAVSGAAGDGAAQEGYLEKGLALIERAPPSPRTTEVEADLVAGKAERVVQTGKFEVGRELYLRAVALHRRASPADPDQRDRNELNLADRLNGAATATDRLGNWVDAERERTQAIEILERRRARDPDDVETGPRLGEIKLAEGISRRLRGLSEQAQPSLESALAEGERAVARDPRNANFQQLVASACEWLAHTHEALGRHGEAERLRERSLAVANRMLAIEPASALWQGARARTEMSLASRAAEIKDWTSAARRLASARSAYEALLARDPTNRDHRRQAAVVAGLLADVETALRRPERARRAWLTALADLEQVAGSEATARARLEWAYGLRGYSEFERKNGRLEPASEATDKAMAILDDTPAVREQRGWTWYRAAVLAEVGAVRFASGRRGAAREAWERSAVLLRGMARTRDLGPGETRVLRRVESSLAAGDAPPARRRRSVAGE